MATAIKALDHLALRGVKARCQDGERFIGGSVSDDRMTLSFKRDRFHPKSCKGITRYRIVSMER